MAKNYRAEEVIDIARNPGNHTVEEIKDVGKRYSHLVLYSHTVEGLIRAISAAPAIVSASQINKRLSEGVGVTTKIEEEVTDVEIEEAVEDLETPEELTAKLKSEKEKLAKANKKEKDAKKAQKETAKNIEADGLGFLDEKETVAFKDMSNEELKAALKTREIKPVKGTTKASVIKMLEEHDAAEDAKGGDPEDDWDI